MNIHLQTKLTIEEFYIWAQAQDDRCELVEGVPKLLPHVRLNHTRICNNILLETIKLLNRSNFEIANGDFAVQTGPKSLRYADVMVMPAGKDGNILSVDDAIVLFEVLSKSTMHEDFGAKRAEYQALESLKAYVILAQDEPMIWLWQRDGDNNWPSDPEQIADGKLVLDAIDVELEIAELYQNVS